VRAGSKLTEVTAAVIELLIEGEWLKPAEAADKRAITQALSRQQRLGDARRDHREVGGMRLRDADEARSRLTSRRTSAVASPSPARLQRVRAVDRGKATC
jgi:hypothetical protein